MQGSVTSSKLTATYSLEDNKLRLYSEEKLNTETYALISKHGFKYAPAQKLFVAPMWTPVRAQVLRDLCGQIQDEKMSLAERSEARAARFTQYSENRKNDSVEAFNKVNEIQNMIPSGQPILVDHYSAKKHCRAIEKMDNNMRKSIKMDKLSKYWDERAEGAIGYALGKDFIETRVNRIKKLKAENRKFQKDQNKYQEILKGLLNGTVPAGKNGLEKSISSCQKLVQYYVDWVEHTERRINYESEILKGQGYQPPKKVKSKQLPIVNYLGEGFKQITKEQWAKASDYDKRIYRIKEDETYESHRIREMLFVEDNYTRAKVFIADLKTVERPKKR
ncbi:MAG: DUF3560 domain-containing protein [Bacteriovoracaceae bacterium]